MRCGRDQERRDGTSRLPPSVRGVLAAAALAAVLSLSFADVAEPLPVVEPLFAPSVLALADRLALAPGDEPLVPFTRPSGRLTELDCDGARAVVAQARVLLAMPPPEVQAKSFALGTLDWLDPHGLWSVAPDAPARAYLEAHAAGLLAELEAPPGSGPCPTAEEVGALLEVWLEALRAEHDEAARVITSSSEAEAHRAASREPFQNGAVTRSARETARDLGRDLARIRRSSARELHPCAEAAAERLFPRLDGAGWSRVLLAAAVRAYVPLVDPHGAWAPLDEEISIYDVDLEPAPPARLWEGMTRTVLGVRIDRGATAPLRDGDVVVRLGGVVLSALSVEQATQLSVLDERGEGEPATALVLRPGATSPMELSIEPLHGAAPREPPPPRGPVTRRVPYGRGEVLVMTLPDIPDDLGVTLGERLHEERAASEPLALLLDLRGNGGGSTHGAVGALSLFLPGAPLFPMRRRDGVIEIERAAQVPTERQWSGALAVLVDGASASAAEMIAGALQSYGRGVVVGERTYGKGCAQEYLDDVAKVGVLRLTTLALALPDGAPLQRRGVVPSLLLLESSAAAPREETEEGAIAAWQGPDVRDARRLGAAPWPPHAGRVGPCHDAAICRALRALGAQRTAGRRRGGVSP